MITDNEVLTVNPIEIPVAVVRTAKFSPWRVPRDRARSWILDKIVDGLDTQSSLRLAEYEKQEDPCGDVATEKELADLRGMREASRVRG